mmetsp:Transcript_22375/g.69128  ORF Transcript_22375/g.69128 Transcript_22375/m.69128 type:complete len:346 (-) Transcript_22375:105-1142(-)
MQLVVAMFIFSLFVPSNALVNIPYFTVMYLEVYRILLAPLLSRGILSLVFALMSFYRTGATLERAYGSAAFGILVSTVLVGTQAIFITIAFMAALGGDMSAIFWVAQGFWLVVMGLMVIDCVADTNPTRRLFVVQIPSKYYPLVTFALWLVFMGPRMDMACSLMIGYAYAFHKLDWLQPSAERIRQWEDTMLGPVTRRPGYISCSAASGMEAWHMMNNPNAGGYDAWGASAPPASPTPASRPAGPSSAQTEGRTLGGETGRALTREEVMARRTAALASRTTPAGPASAPSSRNTRTQEEHEVLTGPFEAQLMHLTSMGFTRHESAAALQASGGDLGEAVARLSGV